MMIFEEVKTGTGVGK